MNVSDFGQNNTIAIDASVTGNISIDVHGSNNRLAILKSTVISGFKLDIQGNDCSIEIGESCWMHGTFRCLTNRSHLKIGNGTTMMHALIYCQEPGSIEIGDDCMFAGGVQINNSDVHSIIDRATGQRINKAADVKIGNHVWLAEGVTVAKGCKIGAGSIVGAKSFVRGKIPENVIVAGVPAKIVKINVEWRRDLI